MVVTKSRFTFVLVVGFFSERMSVTLAFVFILYLKYTLVCSFVSFYCDDD